MAITQTMTQHETSEVLGINGSGRIGKLSIWHHVARRYFGGLVINFGREVGTDLEAVCQVLEKDSTYGSMHRFLFGVNAKRAISIVDRDKRLLDIAGTPVTVLQKYRNPKDIGWREHGIRIVVDCTGAFADPTVPADGSGGALRGHLAAGAQKVINSSAFKIKDKALSMPDDATTMIFGINHESFDAYRHHVISAASCTTTALAHMVKPLLDFFDRSHIMTASMSTVHAPTNTQSVLDSVPKAGASDLRKSRSVLNSIILTSTNAARALEMVIPAIREIGFMADSVRVSLPTESLIILNVTFQSRIEGGKATVNHHVINDIYRQAAAGALQGLLVYSEEQNVPADVLGMDAAVVIEGSENHTRTGFVQLDLSRLEALKGVDLSSMPSPIIELPVTHAKIFGWYDNEYGSYTNRLGDLVVHVHQSMD